MMKEENKLPFFVENKLITFFVYLGLIGSIGCIIIGVMLFIIFR